MLRRESVALCCWCGCLLLAGLVASVVPEDGLCLLQTPAGAIPAKSTSARKALGCRGAFKVKTITVQERGQTVEFIVLENTATRESVDIAYNLGGKVDSIRLLSPVTGKVRELVLSSGRNATRLLDMWIGVNGILLPFANRIANGTYTFDGRKYEVEPTSHGFLIGRKMQVVSERQEADFAAVTLAYSFNDASDEQSAPIGYPFQLSVELTYTLDVHGLSITTVAKNRAEEGGPLPFYMGTHPYFIVQDLSQSSVVFDPCSAWNRIEVDENLIPTTNTFPFNGFRGKPIGGSYEKPTKWDDGFKAMASSAECPVLQTEIYDPSSRDSSVIWMNSPEFKWLQVFTGGTPKMGQVVAVEPMSGETNAFNNGQAVELLLQARERWQGTFGYRLAAPSPLVRHSGQLSRER